VFKEALKQTERCDALFGAEVLNSLGVLYGQTGKLKQAATAFDKALTLLEKQPGVTESWFLFEQNLTSFAAVLQAQGKILDAERLLVRASRLLEDLPNNAYTEFARTFRSLTSEGLGLLHYRQGRIDEAEQEFTRSMQSEMTRRGGGDRVRLAKLSSELADVFVARGRYEDAKSLYQQALHDASNDSAETATLLEHFSKLLRILKADKQADEMAFRATRIRAGLAYTTRIK